MSESWELKPTAEERHKALYDRASPSELRDIKLRAAQRKADGDDKLDWSKLTAKKPIPKRLTRGERRMLGTLENEIRAPVQDNPTADKLVSRHLAQWVGEELHITAEGRATLAAWDEAH